MLSPFTSAFPFASTMRAVIPIGSSVAVISTTWRTTRVAAGWRPAEVMAKKCDSRGWLTRAAPLAVTQLVLTYFLVKASALAVKEELLLLTCGPNGNVIRIIPALNVTSDEVQAGLSRLTQALKAATT